MKKYDNYKDLGIEWIGEIPEDWEVIKLGGVCSFVRGNSSFKKDELLSKGNYVALQYGKTYKVDKVDENFEFYVNDKFYKDSQVVNYGDVIIISTSETIEDLGHSVFYNRKDIGLLGGEQMLLKPNSEMVNGKYLYYSSKNFTRELQKYATGLKVYRFNISHLKTIYISNPPLTEQTAIANYLDRKTTEIDELIADKKRLLELYEEEKTAIINQAVTKGINPNLPAGKAGVPMKDSGIEWLGEIPEHWTIARLKYLGEFINGYSFKSTEFVSSGVRVLKISNIQNMRIDWSDESFIDVEFYETQSNFRVLKNDLVFALTRPIISTGIKVALMDLDEKILLNQRNSIYRPTEIDVKWIYYLLLSAKFIQEFDSRIDKTGQQPNISSNDIANITIPIPPSQEVSEITELVDATTIKIDKEILKVRKLIDLLTEYRTALISEVVTGKIKVI